MAVSSGWNYFDSFGTFDPAYLPSHRYPEGKCNFEVPRVACRLWILATCAEKTFFVKIYAMQLNVAESCFTDNKFQGHVSAQTHNLANLRYQYWYQNSPKIQQSLQSLQLKWQFKQAEKHRSSPLKAAGRPRKRDTFCVGTALHVIVEHSSSADHISPSARWTADSCWLTKSRPVQKVLPSSPLAVIHLPSPVMRGIPERAKGGAHWLSRRSGCTLEVKGGRYGNPLLPASQV